MNSFDTLPRKQKVYLYILLVGYLLIGIGDIYLVGIKNSEIIEDSNGGSSNYSDTETFNVIKIIVAASLVFIDFMISVFILISLQAGIECTNCCCGPCAQTPQCTKCGSFCINCITNNALYHPLTIQLILGFIDIILTFTVIKIKNANIILILVFLFVIEISTIVYYVLSKCYFNKIPEITSPVANTSNVTNVTVNQQKQPSLPMTTNTESTSNQKVYENK